MRPGFREVLVRSVLDGEFRDAVRSDPDGALEGFDLSEAEKAALRHGDDRLLKLLGAVFAAPPPDAGADHDAPASAVPAQNMSTPTIRLLLRLMLSVEATPDAQAELHSAAALQMLPEGADPAAAPAPQVDPSALPGTRLRDTVLEVRVMPHVTRDASGAFDVSCLHATLPVAAAAPAAPDSGVQAASPALRARAEAVREAAPDKRYGALRDLIAALDEDAADA